MSKISIITPCLPSRADYLAACGASVEQVRSAHPEVEWEWIVAFDGPGGPATVAGADHIVRLPKHRGVAAARNYALGQATGEFLVALDADDELVAEGVIAAQAHMEAEPRLGWIACNRVLITGEKTVHWHGDRTWEPGQVADEWAAPMAFHANTLVMRTALVRALGGWPALGACQDLLLTLRLSEGHAGRSIGEVLVRYRAWEGQTTADPSFRSEQLLSYRFIEASINEARRAVGGELITHPEPLGGLGSLPFHA